MSNLKEQLSYMSNLKEQLIRVGYEHPELRDDIRPVLSHLKNSSDERDVPMSVQDAADFARKHFRKVKVKYDSMDKDWMLLANDGGRYWTVNLRYRERGGWSSVTWGEKERLFQPVKKHIERAASR